MSEEVNQYCMCAVHVDALRMQYNMHVHQPVSLLLALLKEYTRRLLCILHSRPHIIIMLFTRLFVILVSDGYHTTYTNCG